MTWKETIAQWKAYQSTATAKLLAKTLRYLLLVGILGYLVYELTTIGWAKVYHALPTNPWFYVLFFVLYFALPISELFIYRLSLKFSLREGLKVFTIKKMLNADVLGYSGEAYLYVWAKKNLKETHQQVFNAIKDNNIISSFASTLMAVLLISVFIHLGGINIREIISISQRQVFLIIGLVILVFFLGISFRKRILSTDVHTSLKIFGIHQSRIACLYLLEAFQWSLVLPEVPFHVWLTFLSVKIIVSRIPFMPSADLLFVSLSLELSEYMVIPQEAIAAMLLTSNVLQKVVNLTVYLLFFFRKNRPENPVAPQVPVKE